MWPKQQRGVQVAAMLGQLRDSHWPLDAFDLRVLVLSSTFSFTLSDEELKLWTDENKHFRLIFFNSGAHDFMLGFGKTEPLLVWGTAWTMLLKTAAAATATTPTLDWRGTSARPNTFMKWGGKRKEGHFRHKNNRPSRSKLSVGLDTISSNCAPLIITP